MADDAKQISMGVEDPAPDKAVRFDSPLFEGGWTPIPNSILMHPTLSTAARLTYAGLQFFARESDSCWPGQKKFADSLGMSDRTLRRALTELENDGLVESTRRGHRSNIYTLLTPRSAKYAGTDPSDRPNMPEQSEDMSERDRPNSPTEQEAVEVDAEKKKEADSLDQEVKAVWDHYVAVFAPPRAKCGPNRIKGIKRALQEADVSTLQLAVDGLKNFRAHKPGDTTIETIWKTFKGTGTMIERINYFASQAKSSTPGGRQFPSAQPAIVSQRQLDVQRGHGSSNEDTLERAKESEAWLLQHGIETARREDGYPVFRAVTGGGDAG